MNFDIKAIIPSGNFQKDKPSTEIEEQVKEQNKDKIMIFLEDYTRDYMLNIYPLKNGKFEIKRYSNQEFFNIWGDWLVKCKINTMDNLTKHTFGIKLSKLAKSKLEDDTIIKDTKHGTTKLNMEKLAKYFQMNNLIGENE